MSDLLEQIAKAEAEAAKALAARDKRAEEQELKLRLERAKAIAEVAAKHDRFEVVDTDSGCVIVCPPKAVTYKKWHDSKEQFAYGSLEALIRPCLIHPDVAGFERILAEQPGALDRVANAIVKMAGAASKEVSEKP